MQKKLLAVAVSGALGAIAAPAALAQNATVSVYGNLYLEYSSISHGGRAGSNDGYQRVDQLQNPGSELGIRGEEKLGGNMSAWFQCATTMDWRGTNNTSAGSAQGGGLCSRDSAFGLKGAFGNVYAGNWATPFKRVNGDITGANQTGTYGAAHHLYGGSSTYGISPPAGNINNTTLSTANGGIVNTVTQTPLGPGAWQRRQSNLLSYDTPVFSGFQGMASVTVGNSATGATASQLKSRLWSLGATYNNGPLKLGASYEKHNDFYGTAVTGCPVNIVVITANVPAVTGTSACAGSSEHAWVVTGAYTFSNNLKLGAHLSQQKADTSITASAKVTTWHIGMDWMISGPHGIRAAYSKAGDMKGTPGATMGVLRPAVNAAGGTSSSLAQIRYVYQMSKRTEMTLGYSRINNSTNANYEMGGTSTSVFPGSDSHAIGISMTHKF